MKAACRDTRPSAFSLIRRFEHGVEWNYYFHVRRFPVTFLIDGYNLMHAVGLATSAMPGAQFERARTRLLDWLADGAKDRAELRVVFDAQNAPSPSLETRHRGVRVRF